MTITIRSLQGEEMLAALYILNVYSLHPSPPFQDKDDWVDLVRERKGISCYSVFNEDGPVSITASTPMTQNMRGKLFPASGVWGVATSPEARRKGYCRSAMASLCSANREAGSVFSNLYPFRESFYERLGYVSHPLTKVAKFAPQSLSPLLKQDSPGKVELKLIGQAYATYREYLSEMRQRTHGMSFFDFGDQAAADRNNLWMALAQFEGNTEGLMMYRIQGEEVSKFQYMAYRLYFSTSRARYLLLNWIARHVDQVDRVEMWLPADEYPENWLSDLHVKVESAIRAAMSRVLDVEKLSGMQVGKGGFTAKVIDPLCPWNEGFWRFEANDGALLVTRTSHADCELTIQGLMALILGTHDPQDFSSHGWGNPDDAIQSIQRQMFPRLVPFLHEYF